MHYTKKVLAAMEKCYATTGMMIDGQPYLFFAGEGNGLVQAFHGEGFSQQDLIWTGGGGTMSVVALQEQPPILLASRGFYSMVEAQSSTIEIIRFQDKAFTHETIASLPYLHRFDVLNALDGHQYILAATIASHKENKEDWSHSGHLYWARLPQSLNQSFEVTMSKLPGDYYINHGFCKTRIKGQDTAFTASREGVFSVTPPQKADGEWRIRQLMHEPVSDIAVCDIDGDGEEEIAAILPFHGNMFKVYRKRDDSYEEIYFHPDQNDFYHTVISGIIKGQMVFVGGARKLSANLFVLAWNKVTNALESQELDKDVGPSNAYLFNALYQDILLCANRQIAQATIYTFDQ